MIKKITIILSLLLCNISIAFAESEKQINEFWTWLNNVRTELVNPPSFNDNQFRFDGYMNAVNHRLRKIDPNINGYVRADDDNQLHLFLFTGGAIKSIPLVEKIEKSVPNPDEWIIETIIYPSHYRDFEIFITDRKIFNSRDIRLSITMNEGLKDINVYLPGLEELENDSKEVYFYKVRREIIRFIGEYNFGTQIRSIQYHNMPKNLDGTFEFKELLNKIS